MGDSLGYILLGERMKIIKRDGSEAVFDLSKIANAIKGASDESPESERLTARQIDYAAHNVADACEMAGHTVSVEEIQDLVENEIMALQKFEVARRYIIYRYVQNIKRQSNTTDDKILALIECNNEEVKQENSNKNPTVNSVQRDYMAGEVSKDLATRILLPEDVVRAHEEGIIHFHDSDYFAQHMHNCDLVNLEDMLQNGTVISGTLIEKPHSFSTACNIATQIIAQVASSQYGGQSISLTHLAPFVEVSRKKIRRDVIRELNEVGVEPSAEQLSRIVEARLRDEVRRGVQTIQYQVVTLMTTNGQAPFVTVFMYLNEARSEQKKHDLAIIIEEVLRQRYEGVKNEEGVWITPAFPKLIYVLEEDNITEDSFVIRVEFGADTRTLVYGYGSADDLEAFENGTLSTITKVTNPTANTIIVRGMERGQEYTVFVQAVAGDKKGNVSTVSGKTLKLELLEDELTSTSAVVEIRPGGDTSKYRYMLGSMELLDYFENGTWPDIMWENDVTAPKETQATGLTPGETYTIFAQPFAENGTRGETQIIEFTTPTADEAE
mgnify:CR=1 FL=1